MGSSRWLLRWCRRVWPGLGAKMAVVTSAQVLALELAPALRLVAVTTLREG